MINLKNGVQLLVNIFVFLFIFTMFNREFLPFGIDIRYINIFLGLLLILIQTLKVFQKRNTKIHITQLYIILFYLFIFISNIMLFFNGLNINKSDYNNNLILNVYNLMSFTIFYSYRRYIKSSIIINGILASSFILFVSMLLVWNGFELWEIFGGDYSGIYTGAENRNFLGQPYRIAGYAQDPNYTCFYMLITLTSTIMFCRNKIYKYCFICMAIIAILISASRTVLIAGVVGVLLTRIYIYISNSDEQKGILFNFLLVILISLSPYIFIKINEVFSVNFSLITMKNRISMWQNAVELFELSPLLGNGLTSFRGYYAMIGKGWYVQSHSTYFQLLSEHGIITMLLFIKIVYSKLKNANTYSYFICIISLIFALTSELNYLPIFPFALGLVPLVNHMKNERSSI